MHAAAGGVHCERIGAQAAGLDAARRAVQRHAMQCVRSGDIQRAAGGGGAELLGDQMLGLDTARGGLQRYVRQLMLAQADVGAARFHRQGDSGGDFDGQRLLRGGEQAGILRACLTELDIEHTVKQQMAHLQLARYAAGDFGRAQGIRAALRQGDGACNPVDFHPLHISGAVIEIARDVLIGVGIALHARGKGCGAQQAQRKQDGNQKGNAFFHTGFFLSFLWFCCYGWTGIGYCLYAPRSITPIMAAAAPYSTPATAQMIQPELGWALPLGPKVYTRKMAVTMSQ